jgi:xylulokinase
MDRRSGDQCEQLEASLGQERIHVITGNRIDPYFMLPKLLWIMENESEIHEKAWKYLQVNGYINYRLTGHVTCDHVHASLTGLYSITEHGWSEELAKELHIDLEKLPKICQSTDYIGTVSREASLATGVPEGVPVLAGTVDAAASALECGVVKKGVAAEMTGTSSCFMLGCDSWTNSLNLVSIHHALSNQDLLIGPISSTGACLKWYRDQIGCSEYDDLASYRKNPYHYLDELAQSAETSKLLFLPYMAGERAPIWDSNVRGAFIGLTHSTSRGQLVRAILEGSAFALKQVVDEAEKSGQQIHSLYAVGGGSSSPVWLQMKASILGRPVQTVQHNSSGAFGNALLVAYASGLINDLGQTVADSIRVTKTYEPDPKRVKFYAALYKVYRNFYEHMKDDFMLWANL